MIPVNVYAESTPNPSAMKFVCSMLLLSEGTVEYASPKECENSPLAQQLFAFSGVRGVFITSNFVTVTKVEEADWLDLAGILREFIRGFLMEGAKVFTNPVTVVNQAVNHPAKETVTPENATEGEIVRLLEEYVRPAVESDGGAIHFRSFHDGVVTVALKGSCSGCPSSTMTLKSGIENLLRQMIPEVKEVVAEAE